MKLNQMMYPLSWPLADLAAALGMVLLVRVQVTYDAEAKVYVALSKDLAGLVIEAETIEEIKSEIADLVPQLTQLYKPGQQRKTSADLHYDDHVLIA